MEPAAGGERLVCASIYSMTDRYEPPSDFLKDILDENVPLGGSEFGDLNLRRLIAMTRDQDRANRDWAALLLAQLDMDTPEVRGALLAAASDEDPYVRAEALVGLARRDPSAALPLVQAALREEWVALPVFEAAAIVAHPSLVDDLSHFTEGDDYIDQLAREAHAACLAGSDPDPDSEQV